MPITVHNMPGATLKAYLMLPVRMIVFGVSFTLMYPLMLTAGLLRALYLRAVVGKPSKILKYGTYPPPKPVADGATHVANHRACGHYPCQQLYSKPLDEAKLRKALIGLCAEDGIKEEEISLKFFAEEPMDWPSSGSYDTTSAFLKSYPKGRTYINDLFEPPFGEASPKHLGGKFKIVIWVYNGKPGKPTVMHYGGSAEGWDGSSNFNFCKELMRRYAGLPSKKVFVRPEIKPESAAKLDQASFALFLAKLPIHIFKNVAGAAWNVVRSAKWAGGNGAFVPMIVAMNFTEEESEKLAKGAKKQGASVFAAFTYASVKACKEVLGQSPINIGNQASLQTRHYPAAGQGAERDFVGDWLIGSVTPVADDFTLTEAQASYKMMMEDLDALGPLTRNAMMAKAYGLVNSGAAAFEPVPAYNDDLHLLDRCLFMNQYGRREMPPEVGFEAWNWNAPIWLGVNTIQVNGKTTTLIGSCMWGLEIVEALRDSIEITLRGIMAKA